MKPRFNFSLATRGRIASLGEEKPEEKGIQKSLQGIICIHWKNSLASGSLIVW